MTYVVVIDAERDEFKDRLEEVLQRNFDSPVQVQHIYTGDCLDLAGGVREEVRIEADKKKVTLSDEDVEYITTNIMEDDTWNEHLTNLIHKEINLLMSEKEETPC